jgi:hypothetical protein
MAPRLLLLVLAALATPAQAEIYRWVDEHGAVHYSNALPVEGVKATAVGPVARGGFLSGPGFAAPHGISEVWYETVEPPREPAVQPRGLDFRKFVSLQRGMSEGELLGIAGSPDLYSRDRSFSTYTYMPTSADPFTTTINLVRGRISEIERARKF